MSFVFESSGRTAARSAAASRRTVREPWGSMHVVATWLGFAATSPFRAGATHPDEQEAWIKAKSAVVAIGDGMLGRSRRDHQPLSMVVLDIKELPQLTRIFGADIAGQFVAQALAQLNGITTSTGFAVRTGATVFTVLLPGVARDRAVAVVHEALGNPCRIECHAGRHDAVLVPEFAVKTVSPDTLSVGDVYRSLRRTISQSLSGDQRRETPLWRERESHGKHVKPQPASGSGRPQEVRQVVFGPAAATIPMPIRPR